MGEETPENETKEETKEEIEEIIEEVIVWEPPAEKVEPSEPKETKPKVIPPKKKKKPEPVSVSKKEHRCACGAAIKYLDSKHKIQICEKGHMSYVS